MDLRPISNTGKRKKCQALVPLGVVKSRLGMVMVRGVLPFGLGVVVGLMTLVSTLRPTSPSGFFVRQSGYRLIQPLLDYEVTTPAEPIADHLRSKVESLIHEKIQTQKVAQVSVYFRDLNGGSWFGIHEHERFAPASLLKVPLLMAYLKQAESDSHLLTQRLAYQGPQQAKPNIHPSRVIETGKFYPVEELLSRMIVYSDNLAMATLVAHINQEVLNQTFTDLGIASPTDQQPDAAVSVKEYATFFRILFNASYLSREMSEKALDYLTRVEFKRGLAAGVPSNIVVAHKFGERAMEHVSATQFHDCGIVYCPSRPYLLCIMTSDHDVKELIKTTEGISRLVYHEVCQ